MGQEPKDKIRQMKTEINRLARRLDEEGRIRDRLKEIIRDLEVQNGYLTTLNDLTTGMINRTDLDQLLEIIVQHACTLARTDHGFMHLQDRSGTTLEFKIGTGGFGPAVGTRIGITEGIAGVALSSGEAFWVKDYRTWENKIDSPLFADLRACIVLPLKNSFGTIGLGRFGSDDRTFSMTEVAMLRRFADMASICIDNARLYHDLARELENRKRAEKILRLSEEEFFSVFDSIHVGFYRTDSQGRMSMANRAALEMLGFESLGDALGAHVEDFYKNPEDRKNLMDTILSRGRISAYEVEMRHRDGRIVTLLVNAHIRRNETGEFSGIQGTVVDISRRKKEETEKVHSQKLAAIGSLAAGIAHEINTPVQYVSDNTEFLKDAFKEIHALCRAGQLLAEAPAPERATVLEAFIQTLAQSDLAYLNEEIPQALSQSLEGLERVTEIVRSMKEFSHSNPEAWELADINRILENTLTMTRNQWKYVARIQREFQTDLPRIHCNPGELSQVFLNMIINACHAIEEQSDGEKGTGTITISTRKADQTIVVCIRDTGAGIPESIQDQVFNPFFTTKAVGRGSGQGLAIAHKVVVDRHKGRLSFHSEPGKGTTFTVALPLPADRGPTDDS